MHSKRIHSRLLDVLYFLLFVLSYSFTHLNVLSSHFSFPWFSIALLAYYLYLFIIFMFVLDLLVLFLVLVF